MKNLFPYIVFMFFASVAQISFGQDVHFSQNFATPLFINPAMTGVMNGDVRLNVAYRNQWSSLLSTRPFRTVFASGEMAFKGFRDADRLATGLMVYNDRGGMAGINTTYITATTAYNVALSDAAYVSLGVTGGVMQKHIDLNEAQFGNQYDGDTYNPDLTTGEDFQQINIWRPSVGAGALFYYMPTRRSSVFMGLGMYHLLRSDYAFTDYSRDLYKGKISAQLGGSLPLGEQWDVVPSLYYIKQQQHYKLDAGTFVRYVFNRDRRSGLEKAFNFGAWTRLTGGEAGGVVAIIPAAKLDYQNVSVGISYDLTTGSLNSTNGGNGGVELTISYVAKTRENRKKFTACPRF